MSKRNDIHRPGAIVPANYQLVLSYATGGDGPFDPPFNVDCTRPAFVGGTVGVIPGKPHRADMHCCAVALEATVPFASTGRIGKCSVCGAHYKYGDVWAHVPTGEHIHIGHDCADKYELLADRTEFELMQDRRAAYKATEAKKLLNARDRAAFLASVPGLSDALEVSHPIIQDIRSKFTGGGYTTLTEKQVALVFKLASEAYTPALPPKAAEINVPAPLGRVTFRGVVVSAKNHESDFGNVLKITVKVTTDAGVWLCWTTCPTAMRDDVWPEGDDAASATRREALFALGTHTGDRLKGAEVEITATLSPGREAHFAFGKRPNGRVVTLRDGTSVYTPPPPKAPRKPRTPKTTS